jgi:cellulose biosynthesis protein BcsQ
MNRRQAVRARRLWLGTRLLRVAHYRRIDVADLLTPARSKQPYRVAIAHRKGGQGKTTTTFYLARELVAKGQKVVLRDTDFQQSLTDILDGLGARRDEFNRRHFLKRLVLVPEGAPLPFRPDFELIDTPPALDDSLPGIRRADGVIIPMLVEYQGVMREPRDHPILIQTSDNQGMPRSP